MIILRENVSDFLRKMGLIPGRDSLDQVLYDRDTTIVLIVVNGQAAISHPAGFVLDQHLGITGATLESVIFPVKGDNTLIAWQFTDAAPLK
jgi:hypothetical protein